MSYLRLTGASNGLPAGIGIICEKWQLNRRSLMNNGFGKWYCGGRVVGVNARQLNYLFSHGLCVGRLAE